MEGALSQLSSGWRFKRDRKVPMVWQAEAAECGLACLAMCMEYHGVLATLKQLREQYSSAGKGATAKQLLAIAKQYGLQGQVYSLSVKQLSTQTGPMVLHWDFNHFVVYVRRRFGRHLIHDPARGEVWLSDNEMARHFTGVAMLLCTDANTPKSQPAPTFSLRPLLYSSSVLSQVAAVVVLSIILQTCLLLSPLYIQTVVDDVVLRFDHTLLTSLALGFSGLLIFQTAVQYLREAVVLRFSAVLQLQLGERLFRHLMALPLKFFTARHIGDIQSRFNAIDYFRDVLSQQLAVSLVDGVLALAALVAMLVYSPALCGIVVISTVLYAAVVWLSSGWIKRAQLRAIQQRALLDGQFIESIARVQTIAQMGWRQYRSDQWCETLQDFNGADISAKFWQIRLDTVLRGLQGIEQIVLVYWAAHFVMQQHLTIGMLFAFLAYKGRFSSAIQGLVSAMLTLRLLPMHRERLADIAMTEQAAKNHLFAHIQAPLLTISDRHINLVLSEGECVAIAGRSGCGKSTLMRALLGLEHHGASIRWACQREDVAAVLQGDGLLSGSLLDNICHFDAMPDREILHRVCVVAGVDAVLADLPMGLDTPVGEYGHALSAGQSQRVQIARALYRRPRVLLLDEATSHLDVHAEKKLMQALRDPSLGLTVLMVAHRPDCLAAADRVIELSGPMPEVS